MKKYLAGVALGVLAISPAMAADMPVKAPPLVTIVTTNWSGCYIGGHGGYVNARNSHTGVSVPGVDRGSNRSTGIMGGGQIGCDYQTGRWVVGISADGSWADATGSHTDAFSPAFFDRTRVDSLGTISGRLGYAGFLGWERTLIYVTGGYAWERNRYETGLIATGAVTGSSNVTRTGWTIGWGTEYAVTNNVSLFSQTNYTEYRDTNVAFLPSASVDRVRESKWTWKGGVNFRWGAGPVIARY